VSALHIVGFGKVAAASVHRCVACARHQSGDFVVLHCCFAVSHVLFQQCYFSELSHRHGAPLQELCQDKDAASYVQKQLEGEGRSAGLKGFEIVKSVRFQGCIAHCLPRMRTQAC
jgi:hypothetical protein